MAPEPRNFDGGNTYTNGLPTFPGGLEVVMVRTSFFFFFFFFEGGGGMGKLWLPRCRGFKPRLVALTCTNREFAILQTDRGVAR